MLNMMETIGGAWKRKQTVINCGCVIENPDE